MNHVKVLPSLYVLLPAGHCAYMIPNEKSVTRRMLLDPVLSLEISGSTTGRSKATPRETSVD